MARRPGRASTLPNAPTFPSHIAPAANACLSSVRRPPTAHRPPAPPLTVLPMRFAAVLMDNSGLTKRQNGIVVINRPEHQLPMFVLDFEQRGVGHLMGLPGVSAAMAARLAAAGQTAAAIKRMLGGGPQPRAPPPPPRRRNGKGKAPANRRR